jgi:hypothetical protein
MQLAVLVACIMFHANKQHLSCHPSEHMQLGEYHMPLGAYALLVFFYENVFLALCVNYACSFINKDSRVLMKSISDDFKNRPILEKK